MSTEVNRARDAELSAATKSIFSLGDHTVSLALSAVSLLFLKFLTDVAELRPALAGLVIWLARGVDAFTDPMMGRISDLTRSRFGRRRGYLLLGAIPFGVSFAMMWFDAPFSSQAGKFSYYAIAYVLTSIAMTVLSIPYMALMPEMANDYDERTSLNTYRSVAAVLGTFIAVTMKPLADALGGGSEGWTLAGVTIGIWLSLPWFAVFRVSFERPEAAHPDPIGFGAGLRVLAAHTNYRTIAYAYILARIAVDLIGAMFLFYFVDVLGREDDFEPTMFLFLATSILVLPFWLRAARKFDKRTIFIAGCSVWIVAEVLIFASAVDWPRWSMFAIAALAAVGYAVAELMPWSMLGDVIDEDELVTNERREGIYVGFFTFLRKLGGATAVLLIGIALDLSQYRGGAGPAEQTEQALTTIRLLTSLAPAAFLALAVAAVLRYPLSRAAHQQVLDQLRSRKSSRRNG